MADDMKMKKIVFKDIMLMTPNSGGLKNYPKMFGLKEVEKEIFPYNLYNYNNFKSFVNGDKKCYTIKNSYYSIKEAGKFD
jgi:hypothetical protein